MQYGHEAIFSTMNSCKYETTRLSHVGIDFLSTQENFNNIIFKSNIFHLKLVNVNSTWVSNAIHMDFDTWFLFTWISLEFFKYRNSSKTQIF